MIRENYSLTVLEDGSLKSNNLQGSVPSEASRKESVPAPLLAHVAEDNP